MIACCLLAFVCDRDAVMTNTKCTSEVQDKGILVPLMGHRTKQNVTLLFRRARHQAEIVETLAASIVITP